MGIKSRRKTAHHSQVQSPVNFTYLLEKDDSLDVLTVNPLPLREDFSSHLMSEAPINKNVISPEREIKL